MKPKLEVNIAGIRIKNPVMTASETAGFGQGLSQFVKLEKLGAFVTGLFHFFNYLANNFLL